MTRPAAKVGAPIQSAPSGWGALWCDSWRLGAFVSAKPTCPQCGSTLGYLGSKPSILLEGRVTFFHVTCYEEWLAARRVEEAAKASASP